MVLLSQVDQVLRLPQQGFMVLTLFLGGLMRAVEIDGQLLNNLGRLVACRGLAIVRPELANGILGTLNKNFMYASLPVLQIV